MKMTIGSIYKHKTSKNICKVIDIKGDIIKVVYPPDSYVFNYREEPFLRYFERVDSNE
jgi:hypothetical protein